MNNANDVRNELAKVFADLKAGVISTKEASEFVPEIVAVGRGFRVTVALPATGPPPGHPDVDTETRVYTPGVLVVMV